MLELESVLERAVASAREPVLEVDKALLDDGLPLGHYRLVSKLGEGGMGEVWRARHQLLARACAVRLIRPDRLGGTSRDAAVERFRQEARAISRLTPPNTVRLYDFGVSETGSLYVAVHVQPHASLVRDGTELFYEAQISIAQAALGTRITVPTVDGAEEVEIKAGTQPATEIRLRGKGVPHLRRAGQRGDLHVMVDVVVPTKLSKKARDLLAAYAEESGESVAHGGGLLEKLGLG